MPKVTIVFMDLGEPNIIGEVLNEGVAGIKITTEEFDYPIFIPYHTIRVIYYSGGK